MQEYFEHHVESTVSLPEGEYDFVSSNAVAGVSKSGNPMITVSVQINHEGDKFYIKDYLVSTQKAAYKFKQFWEGVGRPDLYTGGKNLVSDYNDQKGRCAIKHEEYSGDVSSKIAFYIASVPDDEEHQVGLQDDDIEF